MKQNRCILFHSTCKSLRNPCFRLLLVCLIALASVTAATAVDRPEYLVSYDPAKGFKPAQRDLTEIYLQLAGSLEAYGSPVPYLRHVAKEHARIESLYRARFHRDPTSFRPPYLTDAYIDKLAANWKFLASDLELEPFAKEFGHMMRQAIKGTRDTGTIVIDIFNQHQSEVFDMIAGKNGRPATFETLRVELVKRLELDQKIVNEGQYAGERRDAVRSAIILHGMTMQLFDRLDAALPAADATRLKSVLTGMIMNSGDMAESELKAAISEWSLKKLPVSN